MGPARIMFIIVCLIPMFMLLISVLAAAPLPTMDLRSKTILDGGEFDKIPSMIPVNQDSGYIYMKSLEISGKPHLKEFVIATVFRDFAADERSSLLRNLGSQYQKHRYLLMRLQFLHLRYMLRLASQSMLESKQNNVDVVVVTSASLLPQELKLIHNWGATVLQTPRGDEMINVHALQKNQSVLYLRPGVRLKLGRTLTHALAKPGVVFAKGRAPLPTMRSLLTQSPDGQATRYDPHAPFHEDQWKYSGELNHTDGEHRRLQSSSEPTLKNIDISEADLKNISDTMESFHDRYMNEIHSFEAFLSDVGENDSNITVRRQLKPVVVVGKENPPVKKSTLKDLMKPRLDWNEDPRARSVNILVLGKNPSFKMPRRRRSDVFTFTPVSAEQCTTEMFGGTSSKVIQHLEASSLRSLAYSVGMSEVLAGVISEAVYPLPVELGWQPKEVMLTTGEISVYIYDKLEVGDSQTCMQELQVAEMSELAGKQVFDVIDARPPKQGATSSNTMIVMKSHLFSDRINRTLHAWARDTHESGVEVAVAYGRKYGQAHYNKFKREVTRRTSGPGYGVWRIDNVNVAQKILPSNAVLGLEEGCKIHPIRFLCTRNINGDYVMKQSLLNVDSLMWLFTYAQTTAIFKHALDHRPDLEYLWLFDYDVAFTGNISNLLERTKDDDSDLLAMSFRYGDIESIIKQEISTENVNMWWGVSRFWEADGHLGRVLAGVTRVSRRMMEWVLQVAFTPENWSVDEVFFYDTCWRNLPRCKYTPLQGLGFGDSSAKTFVPREYRGFEEKMKEYGGQPMNFLYHAVKSGTVDTKLEPWLEV